MIDDKWQVGLKNKDGTVPENILACGECLRYLLFEKLALDDDPKFSTYMNEMRSIISVTLGSGNLGDVITRH